MRLLISLLLVVNVCFGQSVHVSQIGVGYPPATSGTITVVASTYALGTDGGVTTSAINTTGANAIVVMISAFTASSTSPTLSDSKGNTWTLVRYDIAGTAPNLLGTAIYRCFSPTVGSGHTFSPNTFSSIAVVATSGGVPSLDQQSGFAGGGLSAITPGSITPSAANTIVFYCIHDFIGNTTPTTPTGYTLLGASAYVAGAAYCHGFWYQIQTVATATNPSTTVQSQSTQEASIANFK